VRADSMASQTVNFPASMVLLAGLTFTIGMFTWTTGADGPAEVMETVQAPPAPTESASTTADPISGPVSGSPPPTTRRPLPRYQGRRLDNTDLVESIDRVTMNLAETLTLVDSIRDRSSEDRHSRPARAGRQRRLDPNLVITATPEWRTVRYRPVPVTGLRSRDYKALTEHSPNTYPYGLVNTTSEYAARIPHLFVDPAERDHVSDLYLINLPEPDHPTAIVNLVDIRHEYCTTEKLVWKLHSTSARWDPGMRGALGPIHRWYL
jgi:hypothetical protein